MSLPVDERTLDEALVRVHRTSSTWRGNLANHAPMAADALVELGRAEAIPAFMEDYGRNLEPVAAQPVAFLGEGWRGHLGERAAAGRLSAHFEAWLGRAGWEQVLREVLPVLMGGVLGGSLHGLIRLGHAVAGLRRHDTPVRRREVAWALGYWASEYRALRGEVGTEPTVPVAEALSHLSAMPDALRVEGIITERAAAAAESERFARDVAEFDLGLDVASTLDAVLLGAATWLVAEPASRFTYLHAITATSALRGLLPCFEDGGSMALRAYVHALAAVRSMSRGPSEGEVGRTAALAELVEAAVASRDDHKIKLAAAVTREHARLEDDRLLAAATVFIRP